MCVRGPGRIHPAGWQAEGEHEGGRGGPAAVRHPTESTGGRFRVRPGGRRTGAHLSLGPMVCPGRRTKQPFNLDRDPVGLLSNERVVGLIPSLDLSVRCLHVLHLSDGFSPCSPCVCWVIYMSCVYRVLSMSSVSRLGSLCVLPVSSGFSSCSLPVSWALYMFSMFYPQYSGAPCDYYRSQQCEEMIVVFLLRSKVMTAC